MDLLPIVHHMAFDELAGSESGAQAQLTRQDCRSDDARELAGVVAWCFFVGTM